MPVSHIPYQPRRRISSLGWTPAPSLLDLTVRAMIAAAVFGLAALLEIQSLRPHLPGVFLHVPSEPVGALRPFGCPGGGVIRC